MLKIKLVRKGKRNFPTYRVCVQEAKAKLTGRTVADLGYFIPREDGKHIINVDKAEITSWEKKGATKTEAVVTLLSGKYSYSKYSSKKQEEAENSQPKEEPKANAEEVPEIKA